MHQQTGLPTFVDAFVPEGLGTNKTLEHIEAMLDWERIGKVVGEVHASPEGRPGYPPLTMVKIALLQQWYRASDPAMEEALRDRISFRRFVQLGWTDGTPDHSTISRFRKALTERGLTERLFAEVSRQLEEQRLLVKQGTLLDATIVKAQARRPSVEEGPGARSATDPDAGWTRKGSAAHFGYKAHLGVDGESGLIRKAVLTSANVNDTEAADALVSGDEAAVYADQGTSRRNGARMKSRGIKDRISIGRTSTSRELRGASPSRTSLSKASEHPVEKRRTLLRCYGHGPVRYYGTEGGEHRRSRGRRACPTCVGRRCLRWQSTHPSQGGVRPSSLVWPKSGPQRARSVIAGGSSRR